MSAPIAELIGADTVQGIADEAWQALIGEDEVLVPLPGELPEHTVSASVAVVGPWHGAVVITCSPATAEELTRSLLRSHPGHEVDAEDVEDALGELANVLGGNVKAILPGPSVLGLPQVGPTPPAGSPGDSCRIDVLWRGQPLSISVQAPVGV